MSARFYGHAQVSITLAFIVVGIGTVDPAVGGRVPNAHGVGIDDGGVLAPLLEDGIRGDALVAHPLGDTSRVLIQFRPFLSCDIGGAKQAIAVQYAAVILIAGQVLLLSRPCGKIVGNVVESTDKTSSIQEIVITVDGSYFFVSPYNNPFILFVK